MSAKKRVPKKRQPSVWVIEDENGEPLAAYPKRARAYDEKSRHSHIGRPYSLYRVREYRRVTSCKRKGKGKR